MTLPDRDWETDSNYVNNFYRVFIKDVTNGTILNVFTLEGDGSLLSAPDGENFGGVFHAATDSVDYELLIHATSTDATAFDFFADEFKASPKFLIPAPIMSPVQDVSPTLGNITIGNGSTNFQAARIGSMLWFRGAINFGSTTAFTGNIDISLPTEFGSISAARS